MALAYFNHRITLKSIVAFMDKLSNVVVQRYDDQGAVRRTVKVPIQFGNKEKFIAITKNKNLKTDLNVQDGNAEMDNFLPRLGVEISSVNYDSVRHVGKTTQITTQGSPTEASKVFNPRPWNIEIELTVIAKTMDDGFQIIEQIMPLFSPSLSVDIEYVPGFPAESVPVVLTAVTPQMTDDMDVGDVRLITWLMSFTMKANYHLPIAPKKIITQVTDNFYLMEDPVVKFKSYEMTAQNLHPVTELEDRADEPTDDVVTDYDISE